MKWYLYLLCLVVFVLSNNSVNAQNVQISAPKSVEVGAKFQITYTIHTSDVSSFRMGKLSNGLEVLFGPSTSEQSNFQIVNGHMSSSSSVSYTYLLQAQKHGHAFISPSVFIVRGRKVTSSALHINVVGNNNLQQPTRSLNKNKSEMTVRGSSKDLFITVTANKKRVKEQEPILLTYKVYTTLDLTQLNGSMPDLKSVHTQEIKLPQQKSFHVETVGGIPYKCVTWSQFIAYPQTTGKLHIPAITYHGVVLEEDRSSDPFDAFSNDGGYKEVKRDILAPGLDIFVDPLPSKPINFSGGVGTFKMASKVDKTSVKAGEPINLQVIISGTGNLKLLKQPTVNFPSSFETYDAKVTDKTTITNNGVSGDMIFNFVAIPKKEGDITIPSIKWIYYDTKINGYKTLQTSPFKIHVMKGEDNIDENDYNRYENMDIRPIKKGKEHIKALGDTFFDSIYYWVIMGLLMTIFSLLLFIFRKRAIERTDLVKLKGKNAEKIATKRLRKATRLMQKGRTDRFYNEVLHALWGYISDRLNISREKLSRENIADKLKLREVDENTIKKFIKAIDECEFERFAPGDPKGNMNKTLDAAAIAITDVESILSSIKNSRTMANNRILFLLSVLLFSLSINATTKLDADNAYEKGNYKQSIIAYKELLKNGASPEIFFNMGNAYYRTGNIPYAILNYKRAYQLSPGDADIRFNLELARTKTIDKILVEPDIFVIRWYKSLVNLFSANQWGIISIFCLSFTIVLVLCFLFSNVIIIRKIGFFAGISTFILFAVAILFAFQQKSAIEHKNEAVVISPSIKIRKTPSMSAETLFVIHKGTEVNIIDKTIPTWRQIQLGDGRQGWLATNQIEEI